MKLHLLCKSRNFYLMLLLIIFWYTCQGLNPLQMNDQSNEQEEVKKNDDSQQKKESCERLVVLHCLHLCKLLIYTAHILFDF